MNTKAIYGINTRNNIKMKTILTLLLTLSTIGCAAEPLILSPMTDMQLRNIQIMGYGVRRDTITKYFGTIRQEVGAGIDLDDAHRRLRYKAYQRGGNAIINTCITYFRGASTGKRYPDYITGEVVVMMEGR